MMGIHDAEKGQKLKIFLYSRLCAQRGLIKLSSSKLVVHVANIHIHVFLTPSRIAKDLKFVISILCFNHIFDG